MKILTVGCAAESNDFESVRLAHDEFIANVSRFCFLHNRVSQSRSFFCCPS